MLHAAKTDAERRQIRAAIKDLRRQLEQQTKESKAVKESDDKCHTHPVNGVCSAEVVKVNVRKDNPEVSAARSAQASSARPRLSPSLSLDSSESGSDRKVRKGHDVVTRQGSSHQFSETIESIVNTRNSSLFTSVTSRFASSSAGVTDILKTFPKRKIRTITSPDVSSFKLFHRSNGVDAKVSELDKNMADASTNEIRSMAETSDVMNRNTNNNENTHNSENDTFVTQFQINPKSASQILNQSSSNRLINNQSGANTQPQMTDTDFNNLLNGFSDCSFESTNADISYNDFSISGNISGYENKLTSELVDKNLRKNMDDANIETNGNTETESNLDRNDLQLEVRRKTSGIGNKIDNLISSVTEMDGKLDNMFATIFRDIDQNETEKHDKSEGTGLCNVENKMNTSSLLVKSRDVGMGNATGNIPSQIFDNGEEISLNHEENGDVSTTKSPFVSSGKSGTNYEDNLNVEISKIVQSAVPCHVTVSNQSSSSSMMSQSSESSSNAAPEELTSPGSDVSFMSVNSHFELSEADVSPCESPDGLEHQAPDGKDDTTMNYPVTGNQKKVDQSYLDHSKDNILNDKENKTVTYKSAFIFNATKNINPFNEAIELGGKKEIGDRDMPCVDTATDSDEEVVMTTEIVTMTEDKGIVSTKEVMYLNNTESERVTAADGDSTADEVKCSQKDPETNGHSSEFFAKETETDESNIPVAKETFYNERRSDFENNTDVLKLENILEPDVESVVRADDGTVTVTNVHEFDSGRRTITVRSKARRTESMSELHEKDTTVVTDITSSSGTKFHEVDQISSYRKLTPKGSKYFKTNTLRSKYIEQTDGLAGEDHALLTESENKSVSTGESWGDTKLTRVVIDTDSACVAGDSVAIEGSDAGVVVAQRPTVLDVSRSKPSGVPEIVSALTDQKGSTGIEVSMTCCVSQMRGVDVFWYHTRDLILPSARRQTTFCENEAVLTLHDLTEADGGDYTCIFRNALGSAETKCQLRVKDVGSTDMGTNDASDGTHAHPASHESVSTSPPTTATPSPRNRDLPPPTTPDVAVAKLNLFRLLRRLTSEDSPTSNSAPTSPLSRSPPPPNDDLPQNDAPDATINIQRSNSGSDITRRSNSDSNSDSPRPVSGSGLRLRPNSASIRPRRFNTWCSSDPGWNGELGRIEETETVHPPVVRTPSFTSTTRSWSATTDGQTPMSRTKISPLCFDVDENRKKSSVKAMCNSNNNTNDETAATDIRENLLNNSASNGHRNDAEIKPPNSRREIGGSFDVVDNSVALPVQNGEKHGEKTYGLSKVAVMAKRFQMSGQDGSGDDDRSSVKLFRRHTTKELRKEPVTVTPQRASSPETCFYSGAATMSTPVDEIDDDEVLYKMLTMTDNFDERRKIRGRIKEIRAKNMQAFEARRRASTDMVKQRQLDQEELKRKKMEKYAEMASKPTCENFANTQARHATNTQSTTNEDGSRTITTTTTLEKSRNDVLAERLATRIQNDVNASRGKITVKTETWNSKDGLVQKSETTQRWGANKPQGPRGAMAAFKQMDAKTGPSPSSPSFLSAGSGPAGGGGASGRVMRSPSSIKQVLLDWCSAMTREYENVNITNFSACWTNGLAFCALIHHFYPDSFEYDELKPENRRYNFTLAFDTAEKCADIAPLLDVEDMVMMKKPDWKCVFTYIQSIYRHLREHQNNKAALPRQ